MKRSQVQYEVTSDKPTPTFVPITYNREADAVSYARICSNRYPDRVFTVTRHEHYSATTRYVAFDSSLFEVLYKDGE